MPGPGRKPSREYRALDISDYDQVARFAADIHPGIRPWTS